MVTKAGLTVDPKPFGFAIHGAIDVFSRRTLWIEVCPSNNNPRIITRYFLDTVRKWGSWLQVYRCDVSTDNTKIEELQVLFHTLSGHEIRNKCSICGKSIRNRRNEAWWSILHLQTSWPTFSKIHVNAKIDGLVGLWCLTPLSTIFQLCRCG